MCGLVGMAGDSLESKDANALFHLLHFDTLRGDDSTGLGLVYDLNDKKNEKTYVLKEVGDPITLYYKNSDSFNSGRIHFNKLNVAIGHNRKATQGKITKETAHPFEFDNIIGAHNGTVYQYSLKELHNADKWDIDSQKIFSHIDHSGNVQEVWDVAEGAMALVWWDKHIKTLNFARNKERPLHFCFSKNKKKIFWASETWMLNVALGRSGVEHENIVEVRENSHYVFGILPKEVTLKEYPLESKKHKPFRYPVNGEGTSNTNSEPKALPPPSSNKIYKSADPIVFSIVSYRDKTVEGRTTRYLIGNTLLGSKVKIYIPVGSDLNDIVEKVLKDDKPNFFRGKHPFTIRGDDDFQWGLMWNNVEEFPPSPEDNNVLLLEDHKKTKHEVVRKREEYEEAPWWKGQKISREDWVEKTKLGCSYCGCDLEWANKDVIEWYDAMSPICEYCATKVPYCYLNNSLR